MKQITLCADDYGMHPKVSEAIVILAEQGRIQATSAIVTSPSCQQDAQCLTPLRHRIDVGLHLNFTEGSGLTKPFQPGFPGLLSMLWRSHCRSLSKTNLMNEIRAQLDKFESLFSTAPDFIDGHQHVHHLPQVRDALFAVLNERFYESLWIRSVSPMINQTCFIKSKVIEFSGAKPFRQMINQSLHKTNSAFAGVYSLKEDEDFDKLITFWLQHLPDGGLIMCHPALTLSKEENIDHELARYQEFLHLQSHRFQESLQSANVELIRFSQKIK